MSTTRCAVYRPLPAIALTGLLLSLHPTPGDTRGLGDAAGQLLIYRDNTGYDEIILPVARQLDERRIHQIQFVEFQPTVQRRVALVAAELAQRLDANGRVQAYGVVFDSHGAIDPSSKDALDEISALLNQRPHLKLHVVGHSDSVGSLAANREISKRRAHSVCVVLVTDYGISRERLTANGMGPLAPLTSNDDAAGRARNRRIELVVQ